MTQRQVGLFTPPPDMQTLLDTAVAHRHTLMVKHEFGEENHYVEVEVLIWPGDRVSPIRVKATWYSKDPGEWLPNRTPLIFGDDSDWKPATLERCMELISKHGEGS